MRGSRTAGGPSGAAALALGLAAALACSAPAGPRPPAPARAAAAPAPAASEQEQQEERLAAIQHAMNELDEGAQLCWASAAAVDGYQLAGEQAFDIDIGAAGATVTVARDNTRDARLLTCMRALLAGYGWAAPLRGQTIRLPFAFRAPSGQSVIDRRLVPSLGQGPAPQLRVAVLLDEQNTGNDAASMLEVELAAGASTQLRRATRAEAWALLTPALLTDGHGAPQRLEAGDMVLVPAGGVRGLTATTAPLRAVLVLTPGGEERIARQGTLPTPLLPAGAPAPTAAQRPIVVRTADATATSRGVTIYLDPPRTGHPELSASRLTLPAGAAVPSHQHERETELLYVLEGAGALTVGGVPVAVTPTSVLQLPASVPHAFTSTAPVRALQFYTPGGPEQRFKAPPRSPP
ncbi:MAG: cupin domain-containing protein [Kofleriaceae bacterium]